MLFIMVRYYVTYNATFIELHLTELTLIILFLVYNGFFCSQVQQNIWRCMFLVRYYLQLIDSAAAPLVGTIFCKLSVVVVLLLSFGLVLSARHLKRCFSLPVW